MTTSNRQEFDTQLASRHRKSRIFAKLCAMSTWVGVAALFVLLVGVTIKGWGWLNLDFLRNFDSRHPEQAGVLAGIWGSFWLILFTTLITVPVGVGAAIYLEEFAPKNAFTRLIQVNLANLAGVPSIVYGILGLTLFVRFLHLERSVVSGALTLSLLILPVVIMASQEALRAIPPSLRHASLSLGATPWQTVRHQVLPAALPGIMTGVILAISRAIGETAPLIMIGALTFVAFTPGDIETPVDLVTKPDGVAMAPLDTFTALPIQIYNWVSQPEAEYQHVAAAGILVLLAVLLFLNAAAIFIRHRYQIQNRW
ncbi:MAG: phosphate ABC transporter permease PstA [Planctomycetaceae bacterium]